MLAPLSHPQSLATVPSASGPSSTTSQGPFSANSPSIELEPGPPFSHIASCDVGSRAAMNQKKVLVGYGPGILTHPVYCCCES